MSLPGNVTVLMTAYNSTPYLAAAVDSLLSQTYENFELIIIDDASTDETFTMARAYTHRDSRVQVIRSSNNGGAGAALNLGLPLANGEFITRQDSDDCAHPDRLAEQVGFLGDHPDVGAVGTNVIYIDSHGEAIDRSNFPTDNEAIQSRLLSQMCFCGPTVMARREAFDAAGYHFTADLATAEDYDLCLRLAEVTQLANLPASLYDYRQHPGSVSRSKRQFQMINKARSVEAALERRFGPHLPQDCLDILSRDYLRAAVLGIGESELETSRSCLEKAWSYRSDILAVAGEEVITRYLPKTGLAPGLEYLEGVFGALLPPDHGLDKLYRQLKARVYIRESLKMEDSSHPNQDRARLAWQGIRWNPGLVFNRDIVTVLLKGVLNPRA